MKKLTGLANALKGLDGKEILDEKGNKIILKNVLANGIASANSPDSVRMMDIAMKIYKSEDTCELEDTDFKNVEDILKINQGWSNLTKSQLLSLFIV